MSEADPNRLPGDDAKPLPADARVRRDAFKDAIGELPAAIGDPEAFGATWQAMHQIGRGLDVQQLADALEVPEDAGEYADALRGILVRIPNGWGRWISCGRGWYPILAELDAELATLLPRYRVYQAKEKFAGLRFYWHAGERIINPDDPEPGPRDGCERSRGGALACRARGMATAARCVPRNARGQGARQGPASSDRAGRAARRPGGFARGGDMRVLRRAR